MLRIPSNVLLGIFTRVHFTFSINISNIIRRRRYRHETIFPGRPSFARLTLKGRPCTKSAIGCGTSPAGGLNGLRATQRLINNKRLSRILEYPARTHLHRLRGVANLRLSGIYGAHLFITLTRFCFSFVAWKKLAGEWTRSRAVASLF